MKWLALLRLTIGICSGRKLLAYFLKKGRKLISDRGGEGTETEYVQGDTSFE